MTSADNRQSPIDNRQSDDSVLYLTTTGRVSGLPREIEIWFVESGEKLYLLAEHFHRAHWVRNSSVIPRSRFALESASGERRAGCLTLKQMVNNGSWLRNSPGGSTVGATAFPWKFPICDCRLTIEPRKLPVLCLEKTAHPALPLRVIATLSQGRGCPRYEGG